MRSFFMTVFVRRASKPTVKNCKNQITLLLSFPCVQFSLRQIIKIGSRYF